MGKEKLATEDIRHIHYSPAASSMPHPSQFKVPCIKLGQSWVPLLEVIQSYPDRNAIGRALVAHISSIGTTPVGLKSFVHSHMEGIMVGKRSCFRINWMFQSNGMPFGITQYVGLLHEIELCSIEQTARKMHEECNLFCTDDGRHRRGFPRSKSPGKPTSRSPHITPK